MTKLEEEIFHALGDALDTLDDDCNGEFDAYARAAAEVAKKYIKKAYSADLPNMDDRKRKVHNKMKKQWLKENGIE